MPSKEKASFQIVICGAGLAGLGAAVCLAQKGHQVTVLEGAQSLNEVGAGIQIPPNSSRILEAYGLAEKFEEKVVWPANFNMRRFSDGAVIGRSRFIPHNIQLYGHSYWLIHRADYQRILYDAAIGAGAIIRMGSAVHRVDEYPDVNVHLVDGEILAADLIIGADGIKSKVRKSIILDEDLQPVSSPNCAFRATVPAEVMRNDPQIAHLMDDLNANCWIGYRRHIVAYPIRNATMYNLVMSHPGQAPVASWSEEGNIEEMRWQYRNWDPVIQKVITHVNKCMKWRLADIEPLPTWIGKSGRTVLIGDAAHAMLPYLASGAATAIEDGAVLGECLDRCSSVKDLSKALKAFEKLRKRRCERIVKGSRANGDIWHLPQGEEQEERDRNMALELENTVDAANIVKANTKDNMWGDVSVQQWLWGYNAFEAAKEHLDAVFKDIPNGI